MITLGLVVKLSERIRAYPRKLEKKENLLKIKNFRNFLQNLNTVSRIRSNINKIIANFRIFSEIVKILTFSGFFFQLWDFLIFEILKKVSNFFIFNKFLFFLQFSRIISDMRIPDTPFLQLRLGG